MCFDGEENSLKNERRFKTLESNVFKSSLIFESPPINIEHIVLPSTYLKLNIYLRYLVLDTID